MCGSVGTCVIDDLRFKAHYVVMHGVLIRVPAKHFIRQTRLSSSMAKATIKVDIVSDTVCPWCYVGEFQR